MTEEKDNPANKSIKIGEETEQELKKILEGSLQGKPEQPDESAKRVEFERDKTFDSPAESVDPTVFDNPATKSFLEKIDVTNYEKETFYEAVLNDEPFTLSVNVLGDKTIIIGSRNAYEQVLCYACLGDLLKEADEAGESSPDLMLWLQRFSCAFAVKSIFDKPFPALSMSGDSGKLLEKHKQELRKFVDEHFVNMRLPRWQAILQAFMVFTAKEKILLEHIANRDFWNPAG